LRRFDHVFCISDKEIEFCRRYNANVDYSPVPVLASEYERQTTDPREKYGIAQEDFVFLALGRLSEIKGQDLVLEAFRRALPSLDGARLVFVGRTDYDPRMFNSMQQCIDEHDLGERVIFTGEVERDEVLAWLRHCDIHVIAVRFMNSGAVVVESWASGTPVIQSDVVDPNLVQDGHNGFLFARGSVEGLSQAMVRAFTGRTTLPKMGEAGFELVRQKYTYEHLIELYRQTFKDVLSRK
jgi:glycosyltransferase involved in cell wall biosynthesis